MPNPEFNFAPNDKIDSRAYEIVEKIFGIEGAFVSNETFVDDFSDRANDVPHGHSLVPISKVPPDDRNEYRDRPDINDERYYVWYPKLADREIRRINVRSRIRAVRLIERTYGTSLKHFKNIDEYPRLTLYEVADFVDKTSLKALGEALDNGREK